MTMRIFWLCLGFSSLFLGVIGIFLPLLPTTPFLLLGAFSFSRSSKRCYNWLVSHTYLGKPIQDWQEDRSIARKTKIIALATILATFAVSIALSVSVIVLWTQAIILSAVCLFIITRPEKS